MARRVWIDLPELVRHQVEEQLGSPVVAATSQASGFSPGSADRCVLEDGRRVFIKAVCADVNPDSVNIHRREAHVLSLLPASLPAPRLLGMVDTGDWVVLILEDVDGCQPTWEDGQLEAALDAVGQLSHAIIPADQFTPLEEAMADNYAGWTKVDTGLLPYDMNTNQWITNHIGLLADLAAEAVRRSTGTSLVHGDLRADNILFRNSDGQAMLLDWPWAQVGSPWFDPISLLVNVLLLRPGFDIDQTLATHPVFDGMPDGTAECFFAGLGAYFTYQATQPPVPGITGLRTFQRDQGVVVLDWLRHRLDL